MAEETQNISALMAEERTYPPDPEFTAQANAQPGFYDQDPDEFWEKEARDRISWFTDFTKLKEWDRPHAKWYLGGRLNVCYNCVDRHVENGLGEKVAYYWEGEPVDDRLTITYADLQSRVVKAANAFKSLGIGRGTKVGVYLGMIPEAPVTLLALARLGAPFTFVFGGFSADSLGGRLKEMECEYLVTQDAANRRGHSSPLKPIADEAMAMAPTMKTCIVVRRTADDVAMQDGRDRYWDEVVDTQSADPASCPCEEMDAEDLFFLMFSSGTTGKPKGVVHTTAGYLVGV